MSLTGTSQRVQVRRSNYRPPLCLSGASVAQTVKHLPTMWETWVRSLGQEDPLQKEMASTPVFLPGESHGWRSLVGYSPWGPKESDKTERLLSFSVSEQQASQLERIDTTHQRGKHTFLWSRIWAGNTSVNSRGDMCFCANTPSLFSLEDGTLAVSSQRS